MFRVEGGFTVQFRFAMIWVLLSGLKVEDSGLSNSKLKNAIRFLTLIHRFQSFGLKVWFGLC